MNPSANPSATPTAARHPTAAEAVTLADLHARLVTAAADAGDLDLGYRTVDSPLGTLLVAATPAGVARVAFAGEGHDAVLADLARTVSPRVLRTPARLDPVARELDEYFAGRRRRFDVPLDLRLARGFRRDVVEALDGIAYGRHESYGELARRLGNPGAVRAVGTACARNPLPLLLPCHRVVRGDGTPGAYRGGSAAKVLLLELERGAQG